MFNTVLLYHYTINTYIHSIIFSAPGFLILEYQLVLEVGVCACV